MKVIPAGAASARALLLDIRDGAGPTQTATANVQSALHYGDARNLLGTTGVESPNALFTAGAPVYGDTGNGQIGQRVPGGAGAVTRGSTLGWFPIARRPNTAPILPPELQAFYRYRWDLAMWRETAALGTFGVQLSRNQNLFMSAFNYEGLGVMNISPDGNWHAIYRAVQGVPVDEDIDLGIPATSIISVAFDYTDGPVPSLVLEVNGAAVISFSGDANMPVPQGADLAWLPTFGSNAATVAAIDWTALNRYRIWQVG